MSRPDNFDRHFTAVEWMIRCTFVFIGLMWIAGLSLFGYALYLYSQGDPELLRMITSQRHQIQIVE